MAAIDAPAVDEAGLARAAAAGDGRAFAELYRRQGERLFNVAHRISGSEEISAEAVQRAFQGVVRNGALVADGELEVGTYLLTATRGACHDLMRRRGDVGPSTAVANGNGSHPSEPQGEIREASMRLPERQREALALRELEGLSYGEIAAIMEAKEDSVAQLIFRGRINLSDDLHGTMLASVAAPSPECERALPLIAMREDDQLDAAPADAAWLEGHLTGCRRCDLGVEAMRKAAVTYAAWAPSAAPSSLLKTTMAKASELAGADWSEEVAVAAGAAGRDSQSRPRSARDRLRRPSRRLTVAGLAALFLLAGLAAIVAGGEQPAEPVGSATGKTAERGAATQKQDVNSAKQGGKAGRRTSQEPEAQALTGTSETTLLPGSTETSAGPSAGGPQPDDAPQQTSAQPPAQAEQPAAPKHTPTPKPAPVPAPSTPAPTTATAEPTPVVAEPVDESPGNSGDSQGKAEPPGKANGHQPH